MITVTDAQNQANALQTLISSLPGPAGSDPATIRTQIKAAALTLQSMLFTLVNPAAVAAQTAAGTSFDALLTYAASTDANLRQKCIDAATSCVPINQLTQQIMRWLGVTGTTNWNATPELAAARLITYLVSYRSITGT
jgi:hypothetical protein